MLSTEKVHLDVKGEVARIILNRPEKSNAVDGEVWLGLEEAVDQIKFTPEVKAVIFKGAGKSFCSGLDLKAAASGGISLGDKTVRDGYETLQYLSNIYSKLESLAVPVIAVIRGGCIGAGMEMSLACDVRIASYDAVFSIPEVVHGIIPDCGGTQRLPRIVGPGMAKELILTARRIGAEEALRIGLVNHLYPTEELDEEGEKMASEMVELPADAIQGAKRALNMAMSAPLGMGLHYETAVAESVLGDKIKHMITKNK